MGEGTPASWAERVEDLVERGASIRERLQAVLPGTRERARSAGPLLTRVIEAAPSPTG